MDCDSGSYCFLFFLFLLDWINSPLYCLPIWPFGCCGKIVGSKCQGGSPNECKWKKLIFVMFCLVLFVSWVLLDICYVLRWMDDDSGSYCFPFSFFFRLGQLLYILPATKATLMLSKDCWQQMLTFMP